MEKTEVRRVATEIGEAFGHVALVLENEFKS